MLDPGARFMPKGAASQWLFAQDERLCLRLNRASRVPWLRAVFRAAGRLGDGIFWYALMLGLLAWHGTSAWTAVAHTRV